jgi:hypothetical protein
MIRPLYVLFLLLCISSCKEITFENPQPEGKKSLTRLPKGLQGKYLVVTDDENPSRDTVIIDAMGYRFGYFDPSERAARNEEYEVGILSDTLVVKAYKGYYFFNLKEKTEWLLRVVRQEKNGDLRYMSLDQKDADFNDYVNKLSLEIRIDSFQVDNSTIYRIDPTPSELIQLVDKGYFAESRLIRIK